MTAHPLSQRIADVLELQPDAPAIEYDGQWLSWGQVGDTARAHRFADGRTRPTDKSECCCATGPVRWRPSSGVLLGGGTVVAINPSRGDERTKADIAALQLPLIIGEPDDLATLVAAGNTRPCRSRVSRTTEAGVGADTDPTTTHGPVSRCGC